MIDFPDIGPTIFSVSLGGYELALRWYALSYIVGFICALYIMKFLIRRDELWFKQSSPLKVSQADDILTYLIIGVILGGRLGYVLFYNFDYYLSKPLDTIKIWDGGMSFHGGFIGVILAVFLYSKSKGLPLWSVADLIAIASPPGLFFGRISNFINNELWGRPTSMPWGVIFPGAEAQACEVVLGPCARHPSQIYEAILEGLILFGILIFLAFRGSLKRPGASAGLFFIGYGLSRFLIEYYRVPDAQFITVQNPNGFAFQVGPIGLTMGQSLSIPMIIIGGILIFRSYLFFEKFK
tara:strand:+ start:265 stop:1149 length:885 start_codon:yes stop_codon:yes gene_type:complete